MTTDPKEQILQANDLEDYQQHIAWKGIVEPWLMREKAQFQNWLVSIVLSHQSMQLDNGQLLTAERCAAYIEAIDGLKRMFEIINKRRDAALGKLQELNMFSLEDYEETDIG